MAGSIIRETIGEISQRGLKGEALKKALYAEVGNQQAIVDKLPKTQPINNTKE